MAIDEDFLTAAMLAAEAISETRVYLWPTEGNPAGFISFTSFAEWRGFILGMNLREMLPQILIAKFEAAQKLYLLGWLDIDLIKAGEFAALACLELALKDRYGHKVKGKDGHIGFNNLLKYMPEQDGLTNEAIPVCVRSGGDIVSDLLSRRSSTSFLRNRQAHGDPLDTAPFSGVLEVVRDLIHYAYRDWP